MNIVVSIKHVRCMHAVKILATTHHYGLNRPFTHLDEFPFVPILGHAAF
jgi:hypothetical protein